MTIKLWGNILDRDINLLTNKTKCMLIKITHVEIILIRIEIINYIKFLMQISFIFKDSPI